jgi:hypothetical protein
MKTEKFSEVQAEEFALAIGLIVRRVRAKAPAELKEFSWTQKSVLKRRPLPRILPGRKA